MKITKRQLKRIIREERALLNESWRLTQPKVDFYGPQQYSESDDSEYNREARSVWLQDTGEKRHKEHVAAGNLNSVNAYVKMQIQSVNGAGLRPEELEQLKSLQAHPKSGFDDIPFIMPAIIERLPDFHDPASQEKFRSMTGTARPAAKTRASAPSRKKTSGGKGHSYDARVLEPMEVGRDTNADAVDRVLADLQRVGANDLADEVDMMIQMGDDDIGGVLAMIPKNIKDKLSEGKQMKVTKRQLRRIIREEKARLQNEISGRNPAAYGKGGPNISGASRGFDGVRGQIDDQISMALSAAKAARDLLPGDNPISREKAGAALEVAIKALLKASNNYRL